MSDCGCGPTATDTAEQRRILYIALGLNATMFVVEVAAGLVAGSVGLIADGLDMLSDASAYAIAIVAIGRSALFKAKAASVSGTLLLLLGAGVLADVVRRAIAGEPPEGSIMIAVAALALLVNSIVLRLLSKQRSQEVQMRATWIFTRADVVANIAVILSGIAVVATGYGWVDLLVGAGISRYVIKEAVEILREARDAKRAALR